MGYVTVFVKTGCKFCGSVLEILGHAIKAVIAENANHPSRNFHLELRCFSCDDAARAFQCMKLSGWQRSVPRVFFGKEHFGGASKLKELAAEGDGRGLHMKLIELSKVQPDLNWPPSPDAAMIKVTDTDAFSSAPTKKQILSLKRFGFSSLLNLCGKEDTAFNAEEADAATSTGLHYANIHIPISNGTNPFHRVLQIAKAMQWVRSADKPVLVHCDSGRRAALVVLLGAAYLTGKPSSQVILWAADLGHDFSEDSRKGDAPGRWVYEFLRENSADILMKLEEKPKQVQGAPPAPPPLPVSARKVNWRALHPKLDKEDVQEKWRKSYPLHAAACAVYASLDDALPKLLETLDGGSKTAIDAQDLEGWTALHYAVWNGLLYSTEALIQMGADVNVQARGRRSTPLHFAGGMGHLGVVQCLLSHGANPLARDEDGWTPSDVAARMMSSEMENQNGPVAPATWKHIIETLS